MQHAIVQAIEIIRGAWRFRTAALVTMWAVAIGGWAWVVGQPSVYEASARVYLDTQSALRPLLKGLAVDADVESDLNVVRQAMLAGPQLERVAHETGLDLKADTPQERDALIANLKQKITISRDFSGGTQVDGVYKITFQNSSPTKTLAVVKSLLDSFVEGTLGSKRSGQEDAQRFLRDQIAEYEKRLSASEERLAEFKKLNVGRMPTDRGDYFARLDKEMTGLAEVRSNLAVAEARRQELNKQLTGEEPFLFGLDTDTSRSETKGGGDVSMRIHELEARREELLLRFTEKHPEVTAVDRTLAELKARQQAELDRMQKGRKATGDLSSSLKVNPVYQNIQVEAKQTEVQVAELHQDLAQREARVAELRKLVNTVPEVEAELSRLNRDYDVTRSEYQALVQRLDTAKLSDQADRTGTVNFRVIEPPAVPSKPVAPNRPLLLAAVFAVALAAGVGMAYFLNLSRPVFFSWRGLASALDVPVIGYVSQVVTATQRSADRRSLIVFAGGMTILLLVFAVALLLPELAFRAS